MLRVNNNGAKVRFSIVFLVLVLSISVSENLIVAILGMRYNISEVSSSPIVVETPRVVLQPGTAGTSIVYTNGTSARVAVLAFRNWWNLDYYYRSQISIVNNIASTIDSGYSVCLIIDTASLASDGKMLPNGDDLRIVYWNGSSWAEIDRDVMAMNTSSTQVWFKTQEEIGPSPATESNYYIYYGNPSAGSPPANGSSVYDFWDDFDDGSLHPAWTFSQIGGASGSYSESGTVLMLNATDTGDLWETSDNFLFLSISVSYDIIVESYTSGWGGSHNTWSKMGGVQLRQSLDANSSNRIMSPVYSAVGATNSYRLSTGGSTYEETTATQPKYCRLSRIGGNSRAWYSTDGISWTELGSEISFSGGLSDPVRLGIHLAGLSSFNHWVEVDWLKVRRYVEPEPSTSSGSEEKNMIDYVDNNLSDVDSSADKGTHSNFTAEKYGPDSVYDTLTEANTGSRVTGYKVQQGRTKLTSATQDITITPVNSLNRAFLFLTGYYAYGQKDITPTSGTGGQVNSNVGQFSAYLYDTSTIRVERSSGTTAVWITWQVIECLNEEFYVYRGSEPYLGSTTTYTVSIGGTVNGSNSLAWVNGATNDQASTSYVSQSFFTAEIGSGLQSTFTLRRQAAGTASGTVRWIVVEFDPNKTDAIQTGETTVTTQTQSSRRTVTISPVDISHSILLFQIRASANGLMQLSIAGSLDSATQISFYAHATNSYTRYIRWYVIDFGSGCGSKQKGQIDKSSDTSWYDIDQALTEINKSRAISFVSLTSAGTGTAFPRPFPNAYIENSTNLNIWRSYYGQGSWIEWQILELPYSVEPPNYELDLEVQWTNVDYNETSEYLCIYTGTPSSESLRVDVWNGTTWQNLSTNLQSGWNNISICSYLDSSTFTIRFEGSNETDDAIQDNWNIDAVLLHLGPSEKFSYDYVLKVRNQVTGTWNVSLRVYESSNVARLANATISFHDGSSSDQIIISNGNITQSEGPFYDLGESATIYISMSNLQAAISESSYIYAYLKILVPGTSTYNLLIITFEIA